MQMRLGVIYEPMAPNAYYRAVFPMRALEQRGHTVVWPTEVHQVPLSEFSGCDLVHCYRRTDRLGDLRTLSSRGVAISFDNDDNYSAAEVGYSTSGLDGLRQNKALFREMLKAARLADLTTTPSELLAERYRAEGARNVAVIHNHLQPGVFGFGSKSKHGGVVVGWVAGREHKDDLQRIPIADALAQLLELHPDVRILTVGVSLPIRSERYEHITSVPFPDILKITGRMDIGIAPLADTAFNRCRSNVKLKEYASGGTCWLASPVGPYREADESQGGMLVADQEWLPAMDALVSNRRRRKRLAKRALAWARTQTLDHHAHLWEAAFLDAIERARQRPKAVGSHGKITRDGASRAQPRLRFS
jgi:glycosyltransferase involved in cell wall biosynthesis